VADPTAAMIECEWCGEHGQAADDPESLGPVVNYFGEGWFHPFCVASYRQAQERRRG
jgi:hypothetical protein